jgi:hypothetical protein
VLSLSLSLSINPIQLNPTEILFHLIVPTNSFFSFMLKNPQNRGKPEAQLQLTVPEDVRLNSLATMHNHIVNSCDRLRQEFKKLSSAEKADEMEKLLQKIFDTYGQKGPKKSKQPKTSHKETND